MTALTPAFVAWRRRMVATGVLMVVLGAVALVGGGLYAGRAQYEVGGDDGTAGLWVGTVGTLAVVLGVVLLKLAMMGPYPERFAGELAPAGPEGEP